MYMIEKRRLTRYLKEDIFKDTEELTGKWEFGMIFGLFRQSDV